MIFQIIVFTLFICICCTVFFRTREHFWFIPPGMKLENNDGTGGECVGLNRHDCRRQASCGLCVPPNGDIQCVGGDWNGPTNWQDCIQYEYGNHFANLSLIDPHQPYWSNPNKQINWKKPIYGGSSAEAIFM